MNRCLALIFCAAALWAQAPAPSLRGVVTDPSDAVVPNALVQLRGPGGEQRAYTGVDGAYAFAALRPGKYLVRVIAQGFTVDQRKDFDIAAPVTLDVQLAIRAEAQVVNVEDEARNLNVDPSANAGALVLGEKELAALSDDPDELAQQLQALAGPSTGPNGGQIFIDGFSNGRIPPKASIREVRVNSNPFSPEYDRPGFGRIEILTRPGSDIVRGQAFFQFNNQSFNSRSPLLTQSTRPPFEQRFYGFNLSGPIVKRKMSFGFDIERRQIDENAFVLATTLDNAFNPVAVNQAIVTPQVRTTLGPRFDYAINPNNTLVLRYMHARSSQENEGVGNFALPSRAFDQTDRDHTVQLTYTSILGAKAVNESRFQFARSEFSRLGDNSIPALSVQGAFEGGGAQIGASGNLTNRAEYTNITTMTHGAHTIKWGGRFRQSWNDDTSVNNFGGTYAFFGGEGPLLDASNQAIPGSATQLSALERYRRTLLFQSLGYSAAQVRALGGGASQFTLRAGVPTTGVRQFDAGLFVNDDWRVRPNVTVSYGMRYEAQTNIGDRANFAPRVGLAWGIRDAAGQTKTVIRAGFGFFYDRIDDNVTLSANRFNGLTQQSFLIRNPDFFPLIPAAGSLTTGLQPQQLQFVDSSIVAPRTYQMNAGVERQINQYARVSVQYIGTRGVHLQRSRNINAPLNGVYPFGDREVRMLTEATGFSRINQLVVAPNINYKKLFLFGFYSLGYGRSDAEGIPADPYNLRAEWGPSGFGDIRHRLLVGTSIPMPWGLSLSPFFVANSGAPYNITTGRDLNGDTFTTERPALMSLGAGDCRGGSLVYAAGFGCFNLNPAPGASIGRNTGRGPGNVNMSLRLARTWSFGTRGESGPQEGGPPPGMGGLRGPEGGRPGGPGGGGPPMMMGGGGPGGGGRGGPGGGRGPGGFFGGQSGKKYNLTLSVSARNVLNTANYAPPSGDLSSPFFGQYRSLAGFGPFGGASTYNRKVDLQLRFTF